MKQRIIALVSLIVSLIAFGVSAGILGHSIKNELNTGGYIIQLIAVIIIVIICATNYVYTCINTKNLEEREESEKSEDEETEKEDIEE